MFGYNNFTVLNAVFSTELFKENRMLQDCSYFLYQNVLLTTDPSHPINLGTLFQNNSQLTTCAGFIGIMLKNDVAGYVAEDSYINSITRRKIYLSFGTKGDELFSNTPKLINCAQAFAKCTAVDVMHENIFGGISTTKRTDGSSAAYPTKLENISYCFHDCDVILKLTTNLFKNQPALQSVAGFVSGGLQSGNVSRCDNVTGNLSELSTLFSNNNNLENVRRFFESTGVSGQIPSGTNNSVSPLFALNPKLQDAKYLFRNAIGITGNFPAMLFAQCPNLTTVKGLFRGCTGITGSIPGALNSSEYLFKCLMTDSNEYASLSDVSELFMDCSNMYSIIPATMFEYTPAVVTVASVFSGCGSSSSSTKGVYESVPEMLLKPLTRLTDVSYLFSGCYNLSPVIEDDGTKNIVPENLFANSSLINNAAGLFRYMKVYNVPASLFKSQTLLSNVSYMFNNCDRSEAFIPSVLFDQCNNISNIECFAGESGGSYNSSYGLTTFPNNIFKPYDSSSLIGQKNISNVFCAFRNNNTATGNAILFDTWNIPPTKYAGCYNMCNNLSNINSVPDNYKQSA